MHEYLIFTHHLTDRTKFAPFAEQAAKDTPGIVMLDQYLTMSNLSLYAENTTRLRLYKSAFNATLKACHHYVPTSDEYQIWPDNQKGIRIQNFGAEVMQYQLKHTAIPSCYDICCNCAYVLRLAPQLFTNTLVPYHGTEPTGTWVGGQHHPDYDAFLYYCAVCQKRLTEREV